MMLLTILATSYILNQSHTVNTPRIEEVSKSNAPAAIIKFSGIDDSKKQSGVITFEGIIKTDEDTEKIEYYIDSEFKGVSYRSPYIFSLDTTALLNGSHEITLKAYTANGAVFSKKMTIVVDNPQKDTTPSLQSSAYSPTLQAKKNTGSSALTIYTPRDTAAASPTDPPDTSHIQPHLPDSQAPSVPSGILLSADDGYTVNITWNQSSDNIGVARYMILRDDTVIGTTNAPIYTDQTVVPGNTYEYEIRAVDASNNISSVSAQSTATLTATSIWIDGDSPQNFVDDSGSTELGVRFQPRVDGKITGVRFYKMTGDNAAHLGSLWSSDGQSLASVVFNGETASGWQEASFSTSIDVTAGVTYVISYLSPESKYGYTSDYFSPVNGGITSEYLKVDNTGGSGVYKSGAGFPASSFGNANYWVDALFAPNKNAGGPAAKGIDITKVYTGYPGTDNTGIPVGKRLPRRDRSVEAQQANSIVENIEITVTNGITAHANNVTINNVRIAPSNQGNWGIRQGTGISGLTVEDSEVYGNGTAQMSYGIIDAGSDLTIRRTNISCFSNGIQANVNVTISDSIVHSPCFYANDHTDAFLATGGSHFNISHNTFHNNLDQTSAIGFFCDFSPIKNVTLNNNLLIGGGYTLYAGSSGTGTCANSQNNRFINNKFSKEEWPDGGRFGSVNAYSALSGNEFSNNTWLEDGSNVLP